MTKTARKARASMDIENAEITNTFLGIEDHGFTTFVLTLEGDCWGQGFGNFALGTADRGSEFGIASIRRVLEVVGVDAWEELPGQKVRVHREARRIVRIGHIVKDEWLNLAQMAKRFESDA